MDKGLDFAKKIAYSSEETLMFTYECAKKMKDTDSIYVECGVAAGAQIIAMATGAPDKIIHAFDSFEGIPLPSNRDDQMPGIRYFTKDEQVLLPDAGKQELISSGATIVPYTSFFNNLILSGINTNNVISHIGWFENIIPSCNINNIGILRLDGDLYNSTYVCLNHLFPKVIEGGIVIIDDWQLEGCKLACEDYFTSIYYNPIYKFVSNIAYFIK